MVISINSDEKERMEFRKKFWANVKEKLKELNIPLNTLQREAGLTNGEFSKLERGQEDFEFDRVFRISRVLNCKIEVLFKGL